MHKSLTIAGSDSSGGAGIQADLKTMTVLGVYGMSAITALTAQNTTGVQSIFEVTTKFLEEELDSIFTDIFPDSVKVGMVSNAELIRVISKKLREYNAKNIVVDPVMVSTSGSKLMADGAKDILLSELFKVADIITPNIPEAEALTGQSIKSKDDMVEAAKKIGEFFDGYILLKGGHSTDDADDLLYNNSEKIWIKGEHIENPNTHGERSCKEKQDKRYDQEHHKLRLYGKPKYRSKEREYGPTRKPDRRERHGRRLDSDQNYKGHKPSDHIHKITPLRAPLSCRLKHQDRCCDGGI